MKAIRKEYHIMAPLEKVWQGLTDPKVIDKWGGGPSKMSDKEGFEFSLWGGDITGKNTKVVKEKLLEQDWMGGKWDKYSKVQFRLTHKDGSTTLFLKQTDVPDDEYKDIDSGWNEYYIGPMKDLLEKT